MLNQSKMSTLVFGVVVGWLGLGSLLFAEQPYDTALEYVESDGAQYLDTGLVLSNDVSVTMELTLSRTATQGCVFGGRVGASEKNISVFFLYGDQLYLDFNDGDYESYRLKAAGAKVFSDRMRLELSAQRRAVSFDNGYSWSCSFSNVEANAQEFCLAGPARIFCMSGGDASWAGNAVARLYHLRIAKGDEVLRDYQPCVKNGRVGLYDRATQTFLPPAVGELAAGPVVVTPVEDLSDEDRVRPCFAYEGPVRYLQSDGVAYLDTGVTLTSTMSADLIYELLPGKGATGVFGSRENAYSHNIALSCEASTLQLTADFSNITDFSGYRVQWSGYSTDTLYKTHLGGDGNWTSNLVSRTGKIGTKHWDDTSAPFSTPGSAYVFKTRGTTWAHAAARLYALVIRDKDEVIRDYEPYLKDGVACLHDRKTDTFLRNVNSAGGSFTAGEPVVRGLLLASQTNAVPYLALQNLGAGASAGDVFAVTSYAPVYDRAVAYLESDGTQHFETGLRITSDMEVEISFAVTDYSNGPAGVFGVRKSVNELNTAISYATSSQISCDFSNGNYGTYRASRNPTTVGKVYTSVLSAQMRTLGGWTNNVALTGESWTTEGSATIFSTKNAGWNQAKARLYALRIRQNGILLRDYQPCVKEGRACLYERVNGMFLFVVEKDAHPLVVGETVPTPVSDCADSSDRMMPRSWVSTNLVLSISGGVTNRFPIGPLQPSTRYACTILARNDLGDETLLPAAGSLASIFETAPETVPAGTTETLRLAVASRKNGTLALEVDRTGTSATRLHLLHGPTDGDADLANWRYDDVIGEFADGEMSCAVLTPVLGTGDRYLRLYTEDGAWSRVVLTDGLLEIPRGTMIIFR